MRVVFLFPGQGAQTVGMCSAWIASSPALAARLAQGSELLDTDLRKLIDSGPRHLLAQTWIAQVAVFCLSFALYERLIERGCRPTLLAGHSLGQFTALAASGSLTFEAGLGLVAARGQLMHKLNQTMDGAMLAVQGNDVQSRLAAMFCETAGWWVSNRNAPGQQVVAGLRPHLRMLQCELASAAYLTTWLDVAGPYHTPLMRPAAEAFGSVIDDCSFGAARIPVIANSSASIIASRRQIREELHAHMVAPVDWVGTMRLIDELAPTRLVEVGPGKVLKGLALRNGPHLRCMTTGTPAEFESAWEALN